jgi:hypothetical protein
MLRRVLSLRQRTGNGFGGELVSKSGLISGLTFVLSHGEAPSSTRVRQYRIRPHPQAIRFDGDLPVVDLHS